MLDDENALCKAIEDLILKERFDNYIDAVLFICEDNGIEPFMAARMLSKPIKEKIRKEGKEINLLPKSAKLPFVN